MARALPIGVQDFKEIRDSNLLYIDKSDMISQILSEGAIAYLYTRPRRFGKSLSAQRFQFSDPGIEVSAFTAHPVQTYIFSNIVSVYGFGISAVQCQDSF